ncbi:hypothetical protein LG315_03210 [Microbacterium marinum]|uniref:hypothetical protein n=1 Tax=Microbacterium marinum TaxID=421115 RepID=UPI00384AD8E5
MTARFTRLGDAVVGWMPVLPAAASGARSERAVLAGRDILAEAIALTGGPPTVIHSSCAVCGSTGHGAPRTASGATQVSVAYAPGLVVVAAAPTQAVAAIGVDVEVDRTGPLDELAGLFAPAPPPDIRRWTQLEAALKVDGRGVRVPPERVVVRSTPGGAVADVPGGAVGIELFDVDGPAGFCISLALARPHPIHAI